MYQKGEKSVKPRLISAIIFGLIVAFELYYYINLPTPYTTTVVGEGKWKARKEIIDEVRINNQNTKYLILIGATLVVGTVVTFAIPSDLNTNNKSKEEA